MRRRSRKLSMKSAGCRRTLTTTQRLPSRNPIDGQIGERGVFSHRPLDAVDRARSKSERFCDLKDARSLGEVGAGPLLYCPWHFGPPKPLALRLGSIETSADALPDHGAFKLSKSPANLKHQATGRRGRVDRLLI